jgi:ABC-2 type transport system permease protein
MTMVLFTSGAIVRERERGNLELLIATPLGRLELMVGKLLPYVGHRPDPGDHHPDRRRAAVRRAGGGQPAEPVRRGAGCSSPPTLGLGLFVSTLAQTQFQAFQLAS